VRNRRLLLLAVMVICTALAGCRAKRAESGPPSSVMLRAQTGAVLVHFPKLADFDRETWMSQIQLDGGGETRALPRLPLADLQSTIVLNVPPGTYRATAVAWVRKIAPSAGGTLDLVVVRSGEITILDAQPIGSDRYPFAVTRLKMRTPQVWRLPSAERVNEYVAELISATTSG